MSSTNTEFKYVQEFATERELCWHLCMTMGLAKQHERLAQALAQTGINEKQHPSEYRAQAQVHSPITSTLCMSATPATKQVNKEAVVAASRLQHVCHINKLAD